MDLARTDRVAHADNRIGRILEGVFRVRPQAAREDHGVSREEDLFFRRHVVCADAVRFDALDAAAGVHVDAVGAQLQLDVYKRQTIFTRIRHINGLRARLHRRRRRNTVALCQLNDASCRCV